MSIEFTWRAEDFHHLLHSCATDPATPYILNYLSPDGKILEAGCGLGRYINFLSEKGFDVLGLELSQRAVAIVQKLAPHLDVRQGDVAALPLEDNSLTGILSLGVLEHFIEGPERPLHEMFRVLKPGYCAVLTVPSFNLVRRTKYLLGLPLKQSLHPVSLLKRSNLLRRLFGKRPIMPRSVPYRRRQRAVREEFYQYFFTKEELETLLRRQGFTVLKSAPIGGLDGIYHEFSRGLVPFRNWAFEPTLLGRVLNSILKAVPFCHNHMHLCVVRKRTHPAV